jgi:hypothetical protein
MTPESIKTAYPTNIPKSQLGYSTNNMYQGYPPLMNDGRTIVSTSQMESLIDNKLMGENNIKSNWQYRKYLTANANEIMKDNFKEASNDVGYIKRFSDSPYSSNPYLYKSFDDNTKPFGYQNSDLKELYLSREQLESHKIAPTIYMKQ